MLDRAFESCAITDNSNFIPHELLHLAHQLFESGVDGPVRISHTRFAPGLSWPAPKLVAHFPAGAGAKDETLKQGIAGNANAVKRTRCCGLGRTKQCEETGPDHKIC